MVYRSTGDSGFIIEDDGEVLERGKYPREGFDKPAINKVLFPNAGSELVWSSPRATFDEYKAWSLNFNSGRVNLSFVGGTGVAGNLRLVQEKK